jgi:hypothetical protein
MLTGEGTMGIHYLCYFLNGERTAAVEPIVCGDDAAAILEADKILAVSPYQSIEVWAGPRQVGIVSRKDPAA